MKNRYLTIEEFKKYTKIMELSQEDNKNIENLLKKVSDIIELQNETTMINKNEKYLRFLMLPSDYAKINKELKKQKEFKLLRELEEYKQQLEKQEIYTEEEKSKMINEKKEQLFKELKIKYCGAAKEEGTPLTIEYLKKIKEEE